MLGIFSGIMLNPTSIYGRRPDVSTSFRNPRRFRQLSPALCEAPRRARFGLNRR
jgi:hypothetical protein